MLFRSFRFVPSDEHQIPISLKFQTRRLPRPPLVRNANPIIWTGPSPSQLLEEMIAPDAAPVMAAAAPPDAPQAVHDILEPHDYTLWACMLLKLFLQSPALLSHYMEHGTAGFPPRLPLDVPTVLCMALIFVVAGVVPDLGML